MKKTMIISGIVLSMAFSATAQTVSIPTRESEDSLGAMSHSYWEIWNEAEQQRIDKDIDTYRKADGSFKTGKIKKGTKVRIVQKKSSFVFGASAFNWGQLGSEASNKRYQELFGGLFNRATVPFYWKDFEIKPGNPRFATSLIDTEVFWNKVESPMRQPHWRRPSTDQIVQWCENHDVAVHGHPLVWGSRRWHYPGWLQYVDIPEKEQRALDSLEILTFDVGARHIPSYDRMSAKEISELLPVYLQKQEELTLQRVRDIMDYYGNRISSWDVVNESAIDYGFGVLDKNLSMAKSCYGPMFSDYVYKSFQVAQECNAAGALLNINDFVMDDRYVNEVRDLLERGADIDVVGGQMHLFDPQSCLDIAAGKLNDERVNPEGVRAIFSKLGQFGVPTCLSEITITSAGNGVKGEMIQAIIARNLYRLWFSLPSMTAITWWNIVDNCGAPGEPSISGLFHRDMSPKTAYYALDQLINNEWKTTLELVPDSKGTVHWRGFKGSYKIIWTAPNGEVKEADYELK